jgi:hypothetical protein
VLRFTDQGFDYAVDRYIVYSLAEYVSEAPSTYIGVTGWPWPTYYTGGWSIGIGFGWYDPWYGYGWGYPAYGWGYRRTAGVIQRCGYPVWLLSATWSAAYNWQPRHPVRIRMNGYRHTVCWWDRHQPKPHTVG